MLQENREFEGDEHEHIVKLSILLLKSAHEMNEILYKQMEKTCSEKHLK